MAIWTMSQPDSQLTFQFDEFELDLSAYELRRSGQPVHLERRPMDLLIMLVQRRNQLVSRTEIAKKLWNPGVFVDVEMGVNTAIRKLRQALQDSRESPAFIETISGKGYRFIAPVERRSTPNGNDLVLPRKRGTASSRPVRVSVAALSAVMVAALIWMLLRYPWRRTEVIERKL